jgi:urea-proton symporter
MDLANSVIPAIQAYWQSAVAAKPSSTYAGYILGGLAWFAIPFTLSTSLGLASRALALPISLDEANAGAIPRSCLACFAGST